MIPLIVAILDRLGPGAWLRIEPGQLPGLQAELASAARRGKIPALQHGQEADLRISLPDGRSLHTHVHPGGLLVVHLDTVDPYKHGLGHWFSDTYAGRGMVRGAITGAALMKGLHGAILGGLVGAWFGSLRDRKGGQLWALVMEPSPHAVRISG